MAFLSSVVGRQPMQLWSIRKRFPLYRFVFDKLKKIQRTTL